jgi:hypothetical protein
MGHQFCCRQLPAKARVNPLIDDRCQVFSQLQYDLVLNGLLSIQMLTAASLPRINTFYAIIPCKPKGPVRPKGLGRLIKVINLIGPRISDLPACSIGVIKR